MLKTSSTRFAKKNRETILPQQHALWVNDISAVLLFALAGILAIVLATYNPNDHCWFQVTDSVMISNKLGLVGAYLSDVLLSVFGLSAWWLVIGIFYFATHKIIRRKIESGSWLSAFKIIAFAGIIICSSIFEYALLNNIKSSYLHTQFGGLLGLFFLVRLSYFIGQSAGVISVFFILMLLIGYTFNFSWLIISEQIGILIEKMYDILVSLITRKKESFEFKSEEPLEGDLFIEDEEKLEEEQHPFNQTAGVETPHEIPVAQNTFSAIMKKKPAIKRPKDKSDLFEGLSPDVRLPDTNLLAQPPRQVETNSAETIEFVSMSIENKLSEFGVEAKITNAETGPVITRYELVPSKGVRGDKIVALGKEIARGLALTNVRIIETIPGKNSMGIEVPNFKRQVIYLKEIFDSATYQRSESKLTLALGKDIAGNVIVTDLAKMPHLLVAGTTGSGKSVAINVMILSILYKATPDEVKFILIDPKMVELSFYQDIPHLLTPVVTDMSEASNALKWAVMEMENRYRTMAKIGCKNLTTYNQKILEANAKGEPIIDPLDKSPEPQELQKWPYIVVIIDELADLMMVTGKKIEQYIARIAQKARAVGIHLIVATQRPSVDVITGLIKANIPARISFQVSSKVDSRTILDQMGAETLLGQGDMLCLPPGSGFPNRVHGAYVNDDELHKVVEYLKTTGEPDYRSEVLTGGSDNPELPGFEDEDSDGVEKDQMFDEAVKFIYDSKRCSISSLQTRFGIGYNRAARIMNHLENVGMVRRNERGSFEIMNKPVE